MSNLEPVYEALQFIERHLRDDITIADAAESVYYSLFHFSRVFNKAVHHTPYDYIMRRRLSEAGKELFQPGKKIIDIAFDFQFNSHETFTRAFKRMFGMKPTEWRKQKSHDPRLFMPPLSKEYLIHLDSVKSLKPLAEEREPLHIAGLMTGLKGPRKKNLHEIRELWKMVDRELKRELKHISNVPGDFYGIATYPEEWERRGWFYMAGVKVKPTAGIPPGFVQKTLPGGAYTGFVHNASMDSLHHSYDYIYHTWGPKNGYNRGYNRGYNPNGLWELERFGEDMDKETGIFIPVLHHPGETHKGQREKPGSD